jgi:ABC-2 type transport system ATP-binding protein
MVRVENIRKSYGSIKALNNISFEVKERELFGLIGPDGSGKTTLLRILTTLILPDSGKANLNGYDIISDFRKIRTSIGYMPGQFSLYTDLTVKENLEFFATVFGTTISENYHLIEDVYKQIEPFKDRLAGRLSGGMKQKLALSCALIHEPELLILDEPTTGVDAVSRKEFWELLKGLKAKGITIIVSTPYMDEAELCDRVALIQNGNILSIDNPKEITKGFGRKLFAVRGPNMYKLLLDLRKLHTAESVFPFGHELHYTDKDDSIDLGEIRDFLISQGNADVVVEVTNPGIEDIFMKLMEHNNRAEVLTELKP